MAGLGAQKVEKFHLDLTHTKLHLVRGDWVQTSLPPCSEVAEDLDGIRSTSQVWVDPEPPVRELVLTVQQVFTEAGRVLTRSERFLYALKHTAQVAKGLEYLCVVVRQGRLSVLVGLSP